MLQNKLFTIEGERLMATWACLSQSSHFRSTMWFFYQSSYLNIHIPFVSSPRRDEEKWVRKPNLLFEGHFNHYEKKLSTAVCWWLRAAYWGKGDGCCWSRRGGYKREMKENELESKVCISMKGILVIKKI